jgi:hypothetical protein
MVVPLRCLQAAGGAASSISTDGCAMSFTQPVSIGLLFWCCLGACQSQPQETPARAVPAELNSEAHEAAGASARPLPDAPANWRSAPEQLDETLLWPSHLLIRHAEAEETAVSFDLSGWQTRGAAVARSRRQALAIVSQLAEQARRGADFAELARKFSEEPETSERGGSLGGIVAGQLAVWPQVLDALSTLQPGGISNVVSTSYGYHIFYRRPPVAELTVSGAHIVIAHRDAPWIRLAARGAVPARSREQARALALRIFDQARAQPNAFPELVDQYSEHRDAARAGDFGTWSTHELTGFPREIETLAALQIGEIAAPIDTRFGFQIIRRTPDPPRQRYAMRRLQLRFDSDRADADPSSKPAQLRHAQTLAQRLQRDPTSFDALLQRFCCTDVLEVVAGRSLPALEAALDLLAPGQIAGQPIDDVAVEYLIPQRVGLDALPPAPKVRFELAGARPINAQ